MFNEFSGGGEGRPQATNILGGELQICSTNPLTGFTRSGSCETGPQDRGSHTVCARVTEEFLAYSTSRGNDLVTPMPEYNFPGLKPGDQWCLCAARWLEAYEAGKAPKIVAAATHSNAQRIVPLELLKQFSVDLN